ncbi:unnamed protein product [Orchesella dallaii]|uniref:Elongation of very long chain fatty acids protein n=1 Tax=Orchesella dallaii TaxID=48710 RepID=A0ABP1QCH7_9HEXA
MTMSKSVELGDTVFIVLRKQPLRFLHWYHHVTVFIYTWVTYEDYEPSLRWFMTMNMFVHAVMYTYYALKAMKIRVSRNWAMLVTVLQLSQMVVGVYINVYSLWIKRNGMDCVRRNEVIQLALTMYASYFVLFANFFYNSYLKHSSSLKKTA